MEIQKEGEELKKLPPKVEEERIDDSTKFLIRWRNSEFYDFVMKAINDELDVQYLKDAMAKAYMEGTSISNQEIADMARAEAMANLRIKNIKEIIE